MVLEKVIPKVTTSKVMGFLTSKEVIVAGVAIIGVPLLLTSAQNLLQKIPFLKDHFTIAFIVLGFLVFVIGLAVGGIFRVGLMGLGAGFAITGVAPAIREQITKVRNR